MNGPDARVALPGPGRARLWQQRVTPGSARSCSSLLSREERLRAAAMTDAARARFTVARGVLRGVLGSGLGLRPDRVPLRVTCTRCGAGDHGPVRLDLPGVDLALSLAHSDELAAVTVAHGERGVGVDVEAGTSVGDLGTLARRVFAPADHDRWQELPADRARPTVLAAWACGEAYAKATGLGLGTALAGVGARLDGDGRLVVAGPRELDGWSVRNVPARLSGYAAAVATRREVRLSGGDFARTGTAGADGTAAALSGPAHRG
ncbi:4'-phosphopantetheinyl transferase superfamily protein [Streptomyces sp. XM4193]|uniref:4'-phosphopantetheinyl transferase family protein n=1 Tax=Streptomyces sp. XM4193 TaxID=2929782 RepID=UPI001FF9B3D4|nr:4'-phosphopantetheinyl transferase superfamily protein [Streptomyces sp. XM4193]MCK1795263.1 4'-phosphopantetheinyl transferase superfamily protein [Streptomyces sp. XM4193]